MKLSGKVLGIPYDFKLSTIRKFRRTWWNSDEPRIIVPKAFGLGYDLNLYQLRHKKPLLFNLFIAGLAAVALSRLLGLIDEDQPDEEGDKKNRGNQA